MPYAECIGLIKAHPQRPIVLKFERKRPHPSAEALLEAGEEGRTEDVVHIMESGLVSIDRADEFSGNSAMMNAAVAGHVDTVTECLARDAQHGAFAGPGIADHDGKTLIVGDMLEGGFLLARQHQAALRRSGESVVPLHIIDGVAGVLFHCIGGMVQALLVH